MSSTAGTCFEFLETNPIHIKVICPFSLALTISQDLSGPPFCHLLHICSNPISKLVLGHLTTFLTLGWAPWSQATPADQTVISTSCSFSRRKTPLHCDIRFSNPKILPTFQYHMVGQSFLGNRFSLEKSTQHWWKGGTDYHNGPGRSAV
jgi:hypothetical protein